MKIAEKKVATFEYKMRDDSGTVLDESGEEPLIYLHGLGNIMVGLEKALEGKSAGDKFQLTLDPADAYGHRDEDLLESFSRSEFEAKDKNNLKIGDQFEMPIDNVDLPEGMDPFIPVTIVKLEGDEVVVDMNHELAGKTLSFDVEIHDVRDATDAELEHGHAHYPGDEHECE